jgi:hypothetical protein
MCPPVIQTTLPLKAVFLCLPRSLSARSQSAVAVRYRATSQKRRDALSNAAPARTSV